MNPPAPASRPSPADWPRATYRVQLHAGFTFDDAAAIVPYLARLGVSHLYCSPILQAVPGSTHGYDVVDHSRLSDDLGGREGFARLAEAARAAGLGVVVDTVPNHMAVAGRANRWWWDVLEDGPISRYSDHFDIDWAAPTGRHAPAVLVPILGDQYGRVLEAGELGLRREGGSFVVTYHDHELPVSPRSLDDLLARAADRSGSTELAAVADGLTLLPPAELTDPQARADRSTGKEALRQRLAALLDAEPEVAAAVDEELATVAHDPDAFDALLDRQNYRLAHWRIADEEIDYRRFFNITTLVGVRVEEPRVFDESHHLLGELVRSGEVEGLRIDHVDGLRDPRGYLERLAELAPGAYVTVEKILQRGETLPDGWPVAGTSGYDLLIRVNDLFVDPGQEEALTAVYTEVSGEAAPFAEVVRAAKLQVVDGELAAELERLNALLGEVCQAHRRHRDHTHRERADALREVLAGLSVYRTYTVPGAAASPGDRAQVRAAVASARQHRPDLDEELLDFLAAVLRREVPGPAEDELAARFQQTSAAVMAKGVEDTAFYRYNRLLALNEVGGDPGSFGAEPDAFHEHCRAVARAWPATMGTLSTHDTKRSADVRARIAVLSERPDPWREAVTGWMERNARHRGADGPDRNTEYAIYQTLVGAWPIDEGRLQAAVAKATKEAKQHTTWTRPDEAYDAAVSAFVSGLLGDPAFVASLEGFLSEHRIVHLGRLGSLAQTALLLTAPGVPDLYQGTELWDLSLVDPDNRRPVDFDRRRHLLDALAGADAAEALEHLDDGGAKLWLVHRLLHDRAARPATYRTSAYEPLATTGPQARRVVGFQRDDLAVVVPRLLAGLGGDGWGDTAVTLPAGRWRSVLDGRPFAGGPRPLAELLAVFPVAVLARDEP